LYPASVSWLSYKSSDDSLFHDSSAGSNTLSFHGEFIAFSDGVSKAIGSVTTVTSSSDSAPESTVSETHSHSHHSYDSPHDNRGYIGAYGRPLHHGGESSHSGTYLSPNNSGDTGASNSHGTSNRTGEASTLSTVSIKIKETLDYYNNSITSEGSDVKILDMPVAHGGVETPEYANIGGLSWEGDADNEYIFGTAWFDKLYGGEGADVLYGFEGDDLIYGNVLNTDGTHKD
jgi:hypothetical protein